MNLAKQIEDIFTVCLEKLELAWWVEIITSQPACTYYFGTFITAKDAELSQNGYIEDLEEEKAQGIAVKIKQCQPINLTICQD